MTYEQAVAYLKDFQSPLTPEKVAKYRLALKIVAAESIKR